MMYNTFCNSDSTELVEKSFAIQKFIERRYKW